MLDGQALDKYIPDLLSCHWFNVILEGINIGLLMIKQFSTNCLAVHGCIYNNHRGQTDIYLQQAMHILRKDKSWVYVSFTHKDNIPAQKMLEKAGFILKTIIPNGYLTGDLLLYSEK